MLDERGLFSLGMKRDFGELVIPPPFGKIIELGGGNTPAVVDDITPIGLDYPLWDGEHDPLPLPDNSVSVIHAHHFLEHLPGKAVIRILRECQRTLMVGGVMYITVPHGHSSLAIQDLDHKSFFNEDTWRTLFSNEMYNKNREEPWRLHVAYNVIIGVAFRNLAIQTQLVKYD